MLKNLHLGTYTIKEVQAPENFYNAGEEKTVTLSYAGQNVETVFSESTFINDRQKAEVSVLKKDKDTLNPLDGGVFGMYAGSDIKNADGSVVVSKGTLIEKAVTGEDGKAVFTADLPIGFSYDVKEIQAPKGYVRNQADVYSFTFSYTNDSEEKVTFTHTFTNERVNAVIRLQKKDAETNQAVPQGDAVLENAVYGLYAREDIVHPDGVTGVIYKAGDRVATLTTDENGEASVEKLYLGEYAIIPTAELKGIELQELSKGERDILRLISVRLLCAGAQKHIFQETEVRVSCAGEIFQAKGKSVQEIGWKAIEAAFHEQLGTKSRTDGEQKPIPAVKEGQTFQPVTVSVSEHYTTPPKPYSDVIFCERKEWIGIEERSSA